MKTDFQVTLISIVLMHILCNILRIFLGILVVSLVEVQVSCIRNTSCHGYHGVHGHHGHHAHHGAGVLHQGVRPVHPLPLGDVPRVGGPPARHAQRLLQLPHLLLRLLPLQDSPHQGACYRRDPLELSLRVEPQPF